MSQASWPLVWVQLLGLTGINIALTWVFNRFPSLHALGLMNQGGRGPQWLVHLVTVLSHPLGQLLLTPVSFFLFSGLLYLLARAVRGQGSFLAQNYTTLLFSVPLTLINYIPGLVLGLIPFVGAFLFGLLTFVVGICGLVWQTYVVMAVHRLSGGKAAGVVVLTILAVILITLVPGGSLLVGP
jgi:hypothetical protein